ncbi:MAG: hypothetical protein KatS3mg111_1583 [Pirellulaceae bacterium]|nr:MAG: hypothetical protein KatS3mg111_1583 [Pirellulaceae bacterium]
MIPRAPFVLLLSVGWWCIDGLAVCAQVAPIAPAPPTSSSATSPDAPGLQVGTDVVGRVSSTPAHAFQRANPGGDFRERYALAKDRRAVLDELIPGTDDYYYYHCLYFQTTGQLDQAAAVLAQWRTARGDIPAVRNMLTRQLLLSYPQNPRQALDFIRNELHLKLDHAPPSNDENVELPSQLDLAAVTPAREILQQLAHDPTLATFEDRTLPKLLRHQLTPRQLRALLSRLTRADVPGVVERIAEELELRDSRGFGWARVHDLLTAEQLDQLQRLRPSLLENERFLRARAARLVPPEGVAWDDPTVRGPYLERLVAWTRTLPPSQNSLKALTLGRLLEFQVSQGKYDRQLFLDYLALPRPQVYYRNERIRQQSREVADLNFSMQPEIPLPPIGDDIGLVRRLLEHFLRTADTVDVFAPYVDRDYLERVWAETKLLYGVGDPATWYPKLGPAEQQALRNRIELRFAPDNPLRFAIDEPVALKVELKNIPELTVRVYHIDALAYLRQHHQPVPIDVDLDGLAPNATWRQQFDIPAHRRHEFRIDLSDHAVGAGVWIVDVFGSDQRARALIRKGTLTAVDRLGDAGHVFRVFDESGAPVADATIELAGNLYRAQGGEILIPYAAEEQTRSIIVRHGEVATIQSFHHRAEKYSLALRLLADRQGIVSGQQATLLIRPRVLCHEQPIDIRLLEEPQLSIRVSQADGMVSTLQPTAVQLSDTGEITHRLLIPARARQITVLLRGRVYNRSADRHDPVEGEATILCNQREDSLHIASFYWQYTPHGIRVLALGRNGEPAVNLPVQVNVKWEDWKTVQPFSLATDAAGSIQLSHVRNIEYLEVSAQRVGTTRIVPNMVHRPWPSRIHATSDMPIELPLGNADLTLADLSLHELRAGKPYRDAINHLTIEDFAVRIAPLAAGAYRLIDHRTGLGSTIHVVEGPRHGSVLLGSSQIVESSGLPGAIIAAAQTDEESLIIRMHQWDAATRIHIVGTPLAPTVDASAIEFPPVSPGEQARNRSRNAWVDSLRVDEEYGYILERHRASKFPGNLLPQPSLLLYPWEVATTENLRRDARVGDAIPSTAEAEARRRGRSSQLRGEAQSAPTDAPTYDFLAHNAIVLENLRPDADGALTLDRQPFRTCSSITIFAVHPWGVDSRRIDQTIASLPTRDRRLTQGFDRGMPMLHVQQVEVLPGGETVKLNEVQSMRRQVYSSLADIMQYFDALGDDGQWSQFSFLQRWHLLEDEARRQLYEAHACHELNLFLYFHDRDFFAAVIRPVLENKLEKQLVDRWLLGQSLEDYRELWRLRRLNALERVLVASRVADLKEGTERYFADWLAANPMPVSEADRRFEIALQRSQLVAGATAGYAGAVGTRGAFGGGEHFGAVPPDSPGPWRPVGRKRSRPGTGHGVGNARCSFSGPGQGAILQVGSSILGSIGHSTSVRGFG